MVDTRGEIPISEDMRIVDVQNVEKQILSKRSFNMANAIKFGYMYVDARTKSQADIFRERSLRLYPQETSAKEQREFLSKVQDLRVEGEKVNSAASKGRYTDLKRYLENLGHEYLGRGDIEHARLGKKLIDMSAKIPDIARPVVEYLDSEDAA